MRVIIAGSRHILEYAHVMRAMRDSAFVPTEIVCGCAYGVDELGKRWAMAARVPLVYFPANWAYAHALVLVWDGLSRGSANMLYNAEKYKLFVHQLIVVESC